jgi:pimeloyl-ACP methyl ester carboxylesterase
MERTVQTPDDRTLTVQDAGNTDGKPVIVHMGTPNTRHLYDPTVADAKSHGLRLIGYDRPGYGGSTPQPGRTVADAAADVEAICDALGLDRIASWGISGGGPRVLACAALLPERVAAVASLASVAPFGAPGLDWFADMGQDNVDDFKLLASDEAAARAKMTEEWKSFMAAKPEELAEGMASLLTPTDAKVVAGPVGEFMSTSMKDGMRNSDEGWWEDGVASMLPWGFELSQISVPVFLLHGRQDKFVPFGHGEWLAAHIPGVEASLTDEDGHLTLFESRIGEVHGWLAQHL